MSVVPQVSGNGSLAKRRLDRADFAKGTAILVAAFSGIEIPTERAAVWYDLLCDMTREDFFRGLAEFCKTKKEIYPGTNIVACIKEAFEQSLTLTERCERRAKKKELERKEMETQKQSTSFFMENLFKKLAAHFPNITVTPETLGYWAERLSGLSERDLERGVTKLCQEEESIYPGTNIAALLRRYSAPRKVVV